jgi:hypothetical protein
VDTVDQVIEDFQRKIQKTQLAGSIPAAVKQGDIQKANQLLRLKTKSDGV